MPFGDDAVCFTNGSNVGPFMFYYLIILHDILNGFVGCERSKTGVSMCFLFGLFILFILCVLQVSSLICFSYYIEVLLSVCISSCWLYRVVYVSFI